MNLIITEKFLLSDLNHVDDFIDLRSIESLDSFGIVSLLCFIQIRSAKKPQNILLGHSEVLNRLIKVGFFDELKRRCPGQVIWDEALMVSARIFYAPEMSLSVKPVLTHTPILTLQVT